MPKFDFEASDSIGSRQAGSIEAASTNDAVRLLSARGLRVTKVAEGLGKQPVTSPAIRVDPAAATTTVPRHSTPVRTKPATDGQSMFLFAQLANLLNSGIAPAQSLRNLAAKSAFRPQATMLADLSQRTGEGRSLADAMQLYPDFFAPGTIGAVRAGETGGYLPSALEGLSEQFRRSHALGRAFWWVTAAFVSMIVAIPWASGLVRGIDRARALIDEPNATAADSMKMLGQGLLEGLLSPLGIAASILVLGLVVASRIVKGSRYRQLRHLLVGRIPIIRDRTSGENLGHFHWHLGLLSKAGISPATAWRLAAQAVPNMATSARLTAIHPGEGQTMTQLARAADIPREFADMIETGETTGTLPKVLEQCGQLAQADVPHKEKLFVTGSRIVAMVVGLAVGAVAVYVFFSGYVGSILKIADME